MTGATIDEVLEILEDKERDIHEAIAEVQDGIDEFKQRKRYIEGRLYEIQYMRKIIEEKGD